MIAFEYGRATDASHAVELAGVDGRSRYLGGGTNLVDLMRETIETPPTLVDVTGLAREITLGHDGSLRIGAAATNTAVAADREVRTRYPMLARAILSGASGQIRNMATVGGNILQRTRCTYFYDGAARCNKRNPGAGCDAQDGFNRIHAILGASSACVATHPSDMCVALAALDADVLVAGPAGESRMKFDELHRLPGERPDLETNLPPGALITAIEIASLPWAARSIYRKVRDRSSYAFALVSVAAAIDVGEDGVVRDVRLALGGVAHKPWRAIEAETALRGRTVSGAGIREAAEIALQGATGLAHNAFKIELARRMITATLSELAEIGS